MPTEPDRRDGRLERLLGPLLDLFLRLSALRLLLLEELCVGSPLLRCLRLEAGKDVSIGEVRMYHLDTGPGAGGVGQLTMVKWCS